MDREKMEVMRIRLERMAKLYEQRDQIHKKLNTLNDALAKGMTTKCGAIYLYDSQGVYKTQIEGFPMLSSGVIQQCLINEIHRLNASIRKLGGTP